MFFFFLLAAAATAFEHGTKASLKDLKYVQQQKKNDQKIFHTQPFLGAAYDTEHFIGGEYTPSGASNELWLAFYGRYRNQVVFDIKNYKERLGVTALRIFLHSLLWESDPAGLLANLEDLLAIAANYSMQLGLVFFDSCWSDTGASTIEECKPTPGVHNSCWMQSPQASQRTNVSRFEPYVSGVVSRFAADPRVAWFEVYNEPHVDDPFVKALREAGYGWAKAQNPLAPVISCWDFNAAGVSDFSDIHKYDTDFSQWQISAFKNMSAGAIFTEAGCRNYQPPNTGDAGSPLAVIRFLETLRKRRDTGLEPYVPGAMLSWELAVGNSNTRWHWGSTVGTPEPAIPWCGWLWPDGTPVSYTEAAALRRYNTGVDDFLYFEHFAGPVGTEVVNGNPNLVLQGGDAFWADGVQLGYDVLVEVTLLQFSMGGAFELVLQATNVSNLQDSVCNTSTLPHTNVCPGEPNERNFIVPPSEPDPIAACSNACCTDGGKWCGAWVVLPGTTFSDKNCNCSAENPCTCCWLKPKDCSESSYDSQCTAGFLTPTPPKPRPSVAGYSVRVDYSEPPTLSLRRMDTTGSGSKQLGNFSLASIPNGVVMGGFNILRVGLFNNGTIAVFFNPYFQETGFVGNSSDALRTPLTPPPEFLLLTHNLSPREDSLFLRKGSLPSWTTLVCSL